MPRRPWLKSTTGKVPDAGSASGLLVRAAVPAAGYQIVVGSTRSGALAPPRWPGGAVGRDASVKVTWRTPTANRAAADGAATAAGPPAARGRPQATSSTSAV